MAVEGDIVEFGTAWGRSATILAAAMAEYTKRYEKHQRSHKLAERRLILFDSFEGLPEINNEIDLQSPRVASGFWCHSAGRALSEPELRRLCARYLPGERIDTRAGWFKDTLSSIPPGMKLGLVHFDCDLYESTRDVLSHLFEHEHFPDGCAVFFDDWNCNRARNDLGQRRAWQEAMSRFKEDWGAYDIGGHKFILHC